MPEISKFDSRSCLVPLREPEEFSPQYRDLAAETIQRTGQLPNSVRAMANSDELAFTTRQFLATVAKGGTLSVELTILIRLVVSNLNACIYCSTHQTRSLIKLGVPKEKIENIHSFETHPAFTENERIALQFAAALTKDSSNIPDEICERFTDAFTPTHRTEITLVAAAMGMLNRFNDGLRIPLENAEMEVGQ